MTEPSAIALKVGIEVFKRAAPSGLAWLKTQIFGENFLLIGESRGGKSSFIFYLEKGVLLPENKNKPRTLEIKDTASFDLTIGETKELRVSVKKATDTRGHDTPLEQSKLVAKKKPNVLLVFLDLTSDWTGNSREHGYGFLEDLLIELEKRGKGSKRIAKNSRMMCIILNKTDKITTRQYAAKERKIQKLLDSYKTPSWVADANDISVHRCVSVENKDETKHIDKVIKHVITTLETKGC